MAMAQKAKPRILLDEKGEKEMSKIIDRHYLTISEANRLREISKKFIIPPDRVAATIALNQFTYKQVKNWEENFKSGEKRYGIMAAIAIEVTDRAHDSLKAENVRTIKPKDKSLVDKIRSEDTIDYYRKEYGDPKNQ